MLVQRRWRWANIETALGQIFAFAGLHTVVCLHPPLRHRNILASRSGYFYKTAGQSQAYYSQHGDRLKTSESDVYRRRLKLAATWVFK